jgi:mannosyltransferase
VSTSEQKSISSDARGLVTRLQVSRAVWCGLLSVLALCLRTFAIGRRSFWLDEAASSMLAHSSWHTFASAVLHRQANMTLYYLLLRGWMHFGSSEAFVRSLSVLFGVAAIPVMYQFSKYVFEQQTARTAALLLSVHQFHVQYSQEARTYSLAVLLTLLSCYFLVRLLSNNSGRLWAAYITTSVLLMYAHVFGTWVLLAQWIFALRNPSFTHARYQLVKAICVIAALSSPLAISLLFLSTRSQLSWMKQDFTSSLYHLLLDFSGNAGNALLLLEIVLLLGSLYCRKQRSVRESQFYKLICIWLLFPTAMVTLASLRWPLLQSRYLIVCLPPFLILVADGLMRIRWRVLLFTALIALVAASLIGVKIYLEQRRDLSHSDDWRDATFHILAETQPGDAVLFPYSSEEIAFREYQDRSATRPKSITLLPQRTDLELLTAAGTWASPDLASHAAQAYARVWMISALQPTDASRRVEAELSQKAVKQSQQSFGFVTVKLFLGASER